MEPLARRGDADALRLLKEPPFPAVFSYLYDWYAEFSMWAGSEPNWTHLHAWAAMMRHTLTSFDVRALRMILNAHHASVSEVVN